jgi:hypothetical protein
VDLNKYLHAEIKMVLPEGCGDAKPDPNMQINPLDEEPKDVCQPFKQKCRNGGSCYQGQAKKEGVGGCDCVVKTEKNAGKYYASWELKKLRLTTKFVGKYCEIPVSSALRAAECVAGKPKLKFYSPYSKGKKYEAVCKCPPNIHGKHCEIDLCKNKCNTKGTSNKCSVKKRSGKHKYVCQCNARTHQRTKRRDACVKIQTRRRRYTPPSCACSGEYPNCSYGICFDAAKTGYHPKLCKQQCTKNASKKAIAEYHAKFATTGGKCRPTFPPAAMYCTQKTKRACETSMFAQAGYCVWK